MVYRLLIFFILLEVPLWAQSIHAELLDYSISCEVNKTAQLFTTYRKVLKINSPEGRRFANMQIYYTNRALPENLSVSIFDSNGKLVKNIKKKEIGDYSALSNYFHHDYRYKEINAHYDSYPYVIELAYSQKSKEFISFPDWSPQAFLNIPVRKSSYHLKIPEDYPFHYKFYHFKADTVLLKKDAYHHYSWQVSNVRPIYEDEFFQSPSEAFYPYARFSPDKFTFGELQGELISWSKLGSWYSNLIKGLNELPDNEIAKIKELVKNAQTDLEKVRILYEYLQNETRYIGVFIGIGGWKPFDAKYVCNNKYGDCKALTNYMKAMLKVIGIKSYYSLIRAGDEKADIDTCFVGQYFNHAVLYVPLKSGDVWLECTNQNIPFGYWGSFTCGKHALVCDGENSFVIKTPSFSHKNNSNHLLAELVIKDTKLQGSLRRSLSGVAFEKYTNLLAKDTTIDRRGVENFKLPFDHYKINSINYSFQKQDFINWYVEDSEITLEQHIQKFGSNLLIKPFNCSRFIPNSLPANRNHPISIRNNVTSTDSVNYCIPEGYKLDDIPEDDQLTSSFGSIQLTYTYKDSVLSVNKRICLDKGIYQKEDYEEFKRFINAINKIENQKILLRKL
ncbi:DUF3857 domain-containing protein [Marinifilum sp.]|uniref:DUF3857 domain-containing protein n=1 Tax=Marinifilum sp. TaxID=2033137 RepID=UPI003BAD6D49